MNHKKMTRLRGVFPQLGLYISEEIKSLKSIKCITVASTFLKIKADLIGFTKDMLLFVPHKVGVQII